MPPTARTSISSRSARSPTKTFGATWSALRERLYVWRDRSASEDGLFSYAIHDDGSIEPVSEAEAPQPPGPILAADGPFLVSGAFLYDPETLEQGPNLGYGRMAGAAWLGGQLYTLTDEYPEPEIVERNASGQLTRSARMRNAVALFGYDGALRVAFWEHGVSPSAPSRSTISTPTASQTSGTPFRAIRMSGATSTATASATTATPFPSTGRRASTMTATASATTRTGFPPTRTSGATTTATASATTATSSPSTTLGVERRRRRRVRRQRRLGGGRPDRVGRYRWRRGRRQRRRLPARPERVARLRRGRDRRSLPTPSRSASR